MNIKDIPIDPDSFVDVNTLSKQLTFAKSTIYKWSSERRIRKYHVGRRVLFLWSDVIEYITSNEISAIGVKEKPKNDCGGRK